MSTSGWNPLNPTVEWTPSSSDEPPRRLRIGILSFSTAEFDSRSLRIARSAVEAGHDVTIYARWEPGLAREESPGGYRIVRRPSPLGLLLPWRRAQRIEGRDGFGAMARTRKKRLRAVPAQAGPVVANEAPNGGGGSRTGARGSSRRARRQGPEAQLLRALAAASRPLRRAWARGTRRLLAGFKPFPLTPMAWAVALDDVVQPADIWHGMWATSLPALQRLRSRHGGRTIYDCRDILLRSGTYENMPRFRRHVLELAERRWARACDGIITVNESYADIAQRIFRTERPAVVMNCPERWEPPTPRPNRIREALGLPPSVDVILYQGSLKTDRGIEESLQAVLLVPNACLVLLGFGPDREHYRELAATDRYRGRLHVLDAVRPQELLEWTASADVMVMAIQGSSLNHRFTTPQKLFEALAAGVPVVASDLPGMAPIVRATRSGELCDPASPASIAAALCRILQAPPETRAAYGQRALEAAHSTYNWEAQLEALGDVYGRLRG
jgi:glycosyltransferase involved in cell wall biosynthesis